MSNFSIFPPILIRLFYSYLILIIFPSSKQISAPNLVWNRLKAAQFEFRMVSFQAPGQISSPSSNFPHNKYDNQITNKIPHPHIILFSSNSFAILSIPYYCQTTSPSSERKRIALNQANFNLVLNQFLQKLFDKSKIKLALPFKLNCKAFKKPEFLCFFNLPVKTDQKKFQSGEEYISSTPQDYQTTNNCFLLESRNLLLNSSPIEPKRRELDQLERKPIKSNSPTDLTNNPSLSLSHIFPTHPAVMIPAVTSTQLRPIESLKKQLFMKPYGSTSLSNLPASIVCVSFAFFTKISFFFFFFSSPLTKFTTKIF